MSVVFAAGVVINLDFITVVDRHPLLARFERDADENARIVILVAHSEDHTNGAVAEFASHPVEQAHTPMCHDQAIFHGHRPWPDMLPAGQVLAVKKLLPFAGL